MAMSVWRSPFGAMASSRPFRSRGPADPIRALGILGTMLSISALEIHLALSHERFFLIACRLRDFRSSSRTSHEGWQPGD